MHAIIAGTLAGLAATAPMTAFMEVAHRQLPLQERKPLPPRVIAMRVADRLHLKKKMDQNDRKIFTLVSHFGFGAAAGALFGPLAKNLKGSSVAKGASYGLTVWAANYLGLLPAFGLFKPATRQSPLRAALMLGAHVVWGASLGALSDQLLHKRKRATIRSLSATPVSLAG